MKRKTLVEATHLGKNTKYKTTYDPSLLVAVPRQENRDSLGIIGSDLTFTGVDVWNAYEVSALMPNGMPIVYTCKIVYPANSEFIVESKSLKLYLNSFNMQTIDGVNLLEHTHNLTKTIKQDLSTLLKTDVNVGLHNVSSHTNFGHKSPLNDGNILPVHDLDVYSFLRPNTGARPAYTEDPNQLSSEYIDTVSLDRKPEFKLYHSALLRSNCKVTKQPDWGSVYIGMTPNKYKIDKASLLNYIVSFRNENHFHEEICEAIFQRLTDHAEPSELIVACFYTRRGGIDINPIRASSAYLLDMFRDYMNVDQLSHKTVRQ